MSDVLFQSGNIYITRSIAKFGNSSYPIANIGSVVIEEEARTAAVFLLLAGIVAGILVGTAAGWIGGVVVFGAVWFLASKIPQKMKLTLKTSSGDVTALSSTDRPLVTNVHQAIESAFTR